MFIFSQFYAKISFSLVNIQCNIGFRIRIQLFLTSRQHPVLLITSAHRPPQYPSSMYPIPHPPKEINELIPLTIVPKIFCKILRNHPDQKCIKYVLWKVMKEKEDDTKIWENIPCSWFGSTNIVKMSIVPKAIYTVNAIPIKILPASFTQVQQS